MNTPIEDGGPAFPFDWKDFQPTTGEQVVREQFQGMSIRDWFAGHALSGLLSGDPNLTTAGAAELAYATADAMLKERSK